MSSQAAQQGPTTVLVFIAILSMNLGIINLFPFPALDGGKLVLNIVEAIRKKPLSVEKRRAFEFNRVWVTNVANDFSDLE